MTAAPDVWVRCGHSLRGRWRGDGLVRCSWCVLVLDAEDGDPNPAEHSPFGRAPVSEN